MEQFRDRRGHFTPKGNENRAVRSIRLTDSAWKKLGKMADERSITRADLLEEVLMTDDLSAPSVDLHAIVDLLEAALKLKANAGGAIKEKIREVLELIKSES